MSGGDALDHMLSCVAGIPGKINYGVIFADCYLTLKAWSAQNGGAAAILVVDDKVEPLIIMDTPEEEHADAAYVQNITIPSALISKSLGDSIKKALSDGEMVSMNLDWTVPSTS